ncbi:serine--tRNA ligase [Patescibacteria group bacterium]|nr:serine--tRNA ligase [Patescibacteria group bacterium]
MLDINFIKENQEKVKKGVKDKGYDSKLVDRVLAVDKTRRGLIGKTENLRAERNKLGKDDIAKGKKIKEELKKLEPELNKVELELKELLYQIPNLPAADVPVGKDEKENVEIKKWGEPKKFAFQPKAHFELGETLDVIDTQRGSKVSGTRFGYLKNEAAILEFALINLAFETLLKEGFSPVITPAMISLESMAGMGYLEHGGQENMYLLEKDKMVLVGTAEQAIGPMYKDEMLLEKELPKRYVGFSSCFRREAGSYGKDTKGIFRVHQFNKVEMLSFTKPEDSDKEHEYLLSLEEKLMQRLELSYRVVKMCSGDLGHPAARKYDIEAWFPSEKSYRETHSVSTCTDYQARRLNIKFRTKDGKIEFVHMLNGTAFSERPILAILENYQQKDGSVEVPKALQKYTGFKKITPKK